MDENSGMTFFSERGALQAAIATLHGRERDMKDLNERLRAALRVIANNSTAAEHVRNFARNAANLK